MTSLRAVLDSPGVAETVDVLIPAHDRDVSSVVLIEDLQALGDATSGSIAVLTTPAAAHATGYRLDVALRLAGSSGVAALVLRVGKDQCAPTTSRSLASRSDIWLLRADRPAPLASVVVALQRGIEGRAAEALDRLERLVTALGGADGLEPTDRLLERASAAFGRRFEIGRIHQDVVRAPIPLSSDPQGGVLAVGMPPEAGESDRVASEVAVALVASALACSVESTSRAANMPVLSEAEVLTEILVNPTGDAASLLRRARRLGIPIDGWHVALRLDIETSVEPTEGSAELEAFETRQAVMKTALDYVRTRGGGWHLGRSGQAFVLLRTFSHDDGQQAVNEVAGVAHDLLTALRSRFPDIMTRCGVGGIHPGPSGLASTAMEARAAVVAARAAGGVGRVSTFDAAGLRRTLVEWYATDTARDAVSTVLQPLDSLGPTKRDSWILTLKTYLDWQGSLTKTAETLYLHRNAVSYRIKRIYELLDVDPDNSDDRLLLQLACRAKAMG